MVSGAVVRDLSRLVCCSYMRLSLLTPVLVFHGVRVLQGQNIIW